METFFFDQDQDSHWYLIPSAKRSIWNSLVDCDTEDDLELFIENFSQYAIGGGISEFDVIITEQKDH